MQFYHRDPIGTWEAYSPAHNAQIAAAIAFNPNGSVRLDGIPFEVRFGSSAISAKVVQVPETRMLQVNVNNQNSRTVKAVNSTTAVPSMYTANDVPVYENRGPGGWERYQPEICALIHNARMTGVASISMPFGPFEVRFGATATSQKVPAPPETGMLQVNLNTQNSRIVRAVGGAPASAPPRTSIGSMASVPMGMAVPMGMPMAPAAAPAADVAALAAAEARAAEQAAQIARMQAELEQMKLAQAEKDTQAAASKLEADQAAAALQRTKDETEAHAVKMRAPRTIACDEYKRMWRFVQSRPDLLKFINADAHGMCFCDSCDQYRGEPMQATFDHGPKQACLLCQETFTGTDRGSIEKLTCCGRMCATYALPSGWCRFALTAGGAQAKAIDAFNKFHVAYHGAPVNIAANILTTGTLAKHGDTVLTAAVGKHTLSSKNSNPAWHGDRVRHSSHTGQDETINLQQLVFMSPTTEYSGNTLYAQPCTWTDPHDGVKHVLQTCFQLRVLPGSYSVGAQTFFGDESKCKQIHPAVPNETVEWYQKDGAPLGSIILTDLLVRICPRDPPDYDPGWHGDYYRDATDLPVPIS